MPPVDPAPVTAPTIGVNVLASSGAPTSVTAHAPSATLTGSTVPGPTLPLTSLLDDPGVMVPWVGSLIVLVGIVLLGRRALRLRREVRAEIAAWRARRAVPPSATPH